MNTKPTLDELFERGDFGLVAVERAGLVERGVQATEVGEHEGMPSFAFADPEGRWFAGTS